jgi:hypothetical protein
MVTGMVDQYRHRRHHGYTSTIVKTKLNKFFKSEEDSNLYGYSDLGNSSALVNFQSI